MSALRVLPPPLWALLLLTALYYLSELPGPETLPEWQRKPLGLVLIVLGLIPPMVSIGHFFVVGTQGRPTSMTNNKLLTGGFFAFTRNPMYLWEAKMRRQFGDAFDAYTKRVRRWF